MREVVGAVDHDVELGQDVDDVVGTEAQVEGDDVDVGVDQGDGLLRRVDLAVADAVHVVQDLALQVRLVDHVHVDDAEGAHTGGGQVERRGAAEATGTEEQDLGVEQLELAVDVDLGEQDVALVAVALLGGELARRGPVAALVLPLVEAAATWTTSV